MTMQSRLETADIAIGTAFIQFVRQLTGTFANAIAAPILKESPSFEVGIKNIFLFAAILIVIGAVIYSVLVPVGKNKVGEDYQ